MPWGCSGHSTGSLVLWLQRLYSTIEQDCCGGFRWICSPAQIEPYNGLHGQYGLLTEAPSQAQLLPELPGWAGLAAQLCRWAELLAGISAQALLQGTAQSTKIWALVTASPAPFHPWFPSGRVPQIPLVIPETWDQIKPPGKSPTMLGNLDIHLQLFSSHKK